MRLKTNLSGAPVCKLEMSCRKVLATQCLQSIWKLYKTQGQQSLIHWSLTHQSVIYWNTVFMKSMFNSRSVRATLMHWNIWNTTVVLESSCWITSIMIFVNLWCIILINGGMLVAEPSIMEESWHWIQLVHRWDIGGTFLKNNSEDFLL